jgi:hypothetical protein
MEGTAMTIAIGAGNTVLIGDSQGRVSAWDGGAAPTRTLYTFTSGVNRMASEGRTCMSDGRVRPSVWEGGTGVERRHIADKREGGGESTVPRCSKLSLRSSELRLRVCRRAGPDAGKAPTPIALKEWGRTFTTLRRNIL